ncbi:hypothetical protein C0J52_18248 [Blattella germanica]|nr:hypothetical protein C0J52_18248 [Blattella germanica]
MSALKKTIALLVTMVVISRVTSIPQPAEDVKKNEIENTNKEKEAISNPKIPINILKSVGSLISNSFAARH